jgi:hypothetical protein
MESMIKSDEYSNVWEMTEQEREEYLSENKERFSKKAKMAAEKYGYNDVVIYDQGIYSLGNELIYNCNFTYSGIKENINHGK